MTTLNNGLNETALALGLSSTADGWYGPFGMYGMERGPDGLLRAVASNAIPPGTGVTDEVAAELLVAWCPHADDVRELVKNGETGEAAGMAYEWVRAWNRMALGTAEVVATRTGHDQIPPVAEGMSHKDMLLAMLKRKLINEGKSEDEARWMANALGGALTVCVTPITIGGSASGASNNVGEGV